MKKIILVLSVIFVTFSCSNDDDDGNSTIISLIDVIIEPSGENCINGGYKIITGIDLNGNQMLDVNEIDSTEFLCNTSNDNEVRISFGGRFTTESTDWELAPEYTYIKNFDIRNYNNISSVIFMATVGVQNGNLDNVSYARLIDVTNDQIISGSEIETSDTALVWELSQNILENIPEETIDIGIELRSSNGSGWVEVNTPYLILQRN